MSRTYSIPVEAKESNKNEKFSMIPSSGLWRLSYGKDHTQMGYFIDFNPLDEIAKSQCSVSYDGREDPDDTEFAPKEEWEYNPISVDQLFTRYFTVQDWVDILMGFGIENLLV